VVLPQPDFPTIKPLRLLGNRGLLCLLESASFHDRSLTSILNIVFKSIMYCVKCKRKTETKDVQNVTSKNGRPMLRGICAECGKAKTQFMKAAVGGDLASFISSMTQNIKLPCTKFPRELHLPGHSFTGPGTQLDLRLNSDLSPKVWSKPVDRVDSAAYHHDLAYAQHSDTANRNEADRAMVNELDNIPNPTVRERLERVIVKSILATKANFGLGLKKMKKSKKKTEPLNGVINSLKSYINQ
jgi:hypothetical protein